MNTTIDPVARMRDHFDVQCFLHREARLLDERRYKDWLSLLAGDIVYRIHLQVARDASAQVIEVAIVDEDHVALTARIEQISNFKLTRAENPPTLARRMVSNLELVAADEAGELVALTNILVYRSRPSLPQGSFYVGRRRDTLRRTDNGFRLVARDVRLDQTTLFDGAISTIL